MALTGEQALALSKKYTRETVEGMGAVKGQDGFSPIITENLNNTATDYRLDITTESDSFTTDNLKGAQGDKGKDGATPYIGDNGNWWYGDTDSGVPIPSIEDLLKYVDKVDGIQDTPIGHILTYMGTIAPKHYLICDGTEYQIADYPYLTQHFIDNFGSVNYFGRDGTTTFAVPDLRGEFLRMTGENSHANQGNGGEVGEHQDATTIPVAIIDSNKNLVIRNASIQNHDSSVGTSSLNSYANTSGTWTSPTYNSYTTRPTNTSVLYCIKYEPTYYMNLAQI